ncbi:hypothetical protein Hanom_Chr03g00207921 [Helianthus anomalus]
MNGGMEWIRYDEGIKSDGNGHWWAMIVGGDRWQLYRRRWMAVVVGGDSGGGRRW